MWRAVAAVKISNGRRGEVRSGSCELVIACPVRIAAERVFSYVVSRSDEREISLRPPHPSRGFAAGTAPPPTDQVRSPASSSLTLAPSQSQKDARRTAHDKLRRENDKLREEDRGEEDDKEGGVEKPQK